MFDDKTIKLDRYKVNESGILTIQDFEKSFEGKYKCIVSTTSHPVMSVSMEVQLHLIGNEI